MSSSDPWCAPSPPDKRQKWYLAIPWTGELLWHVLDIRAADVDSDSTTDPAVSARIARAKADKDQDYPSYLFNWAIKDIGGIIEKKNLGEEIPEIEMAYYNPSKTRMIAMLVLRTKRGDSESDLDESPDLHEPRATDAHVEALRSKGWVVGWYRAGPNWF
ncbi:hypothetical protein GSI_08591 [Ganoderma sinense ZZ0214-1]|uniref:Uncharacterized protein n=1 Tax=Ganoderma sinense ZZ0214-1 TaxID=1077348 RepID=A0A2G8S454_9APHY|nr:hypothetical protein GSI_08591 [Ganoderma sinense ZZ0214-1]